MCKIAVAPLWERGLKHIRSPVAFASAAVAPLWERGLKPWRIWIVAYMVFRRSLMGAWIETPDH